MELMKRAELAHEEERIEYEDLATDDKSPPARANTMSPDDGCLLEFLILDTTNPSLLATYCVYVTL